MVAWSVPSVLLAAFVAAGLPWASAVAPAAPRDSSVLAADNAEHRGNLVRREMLSPTAAAAFSERAARTVPGQNEVIDRILDGQVNGSAMVGDETAGEKVFWLEAGCRALMPDPVLAGKFASVDDKVGKIQCCKDEPNNNGTYCYRKHGETCLSSNETNLVSFSEAAIACETNGYRLCTKQELVVDLAMGCCRSGCGIDDALVWTSTFSFKGLKDNNEVLKAEIESVKNENLRIEQEHKELESKLGELQAAVNDTQIPEGYVPEPPEDTLRQAPIHTITGEEAEALARENSRLWYEVEAMRRENDELKDHIVAIVNGTIVTRKSGGTATAAEDISSNETVTGDAEHEHEQAAPAITESDAPIADGEVGTTDTMISRLGDADVRANLSHTKLTNTAESSKDFATPAPGDIKVGPQVVHSAAADLSAFWATVFLTAGSLLSGSA